jgi:hypothetical protein
MMITRKSVRSRAREQGYLSVARLLRARAQHIKPTCCAPWVHPRRRRTNCQRPIRVVAHHALSVPHKAWSADCRVREWRGRLCAPRGVPGLGPCRAGRHADTVMVSNGSHEHGKLCVERSMSVALHQHDLDRHLGRCSPFFVYVDQATPCQSWLSNIFLRGFDNYVSKK